MDFLFILHPPLQFLYLAAETAQELAGEADTLVGVRHHHPQGIREVLAENEIDLVLVFLHQLDQVFPGFFRPLEIAVDHIAQLIDSRVSILGKGQLAGLRQRAELVQDLEVLVLVVEVLLGEEIVEGFLPGLRIALILLHFQDLVDYLHAELVGAHLQHPLVGKDQRRNPQGAVVGVLAGELAADYGLERLGGNIGQV